MTGSDITRRREAIGLSTDQLAATLDEHADQVAAWEKARKPFPRSLSRRLEWVLALAERDHALRVAGLAPCPVAEGLMATATTQQDPESLRNLSQQLETHTATCQTCQQRHAVWDAQGPLPPPPLPPFMAALTALYTYVERLPSYLRPAVWGAVGFGALTVFRAGIMLAASRGAGWQQAGLAVLVALGVGGYGGAAWGLASHFTRARFATLGRIGDYLTGIVVALAMAVAFSLPAALFNLAPVFRTWFWWSLLTIGAVLIGLVLGHRIFRSPPPTIGG